MKMNVKKNSGVSLGIWIVVLFISFFGQSLYAQGEKNKVVTLSAKELFDGLKNNSLQFDYNQEIIIMGILKETGSSIIYNSSYLLISDKANGYTYVKAVLADKNKRNEYKNGQRVKIRARFYEERDKVIVVKDAKN